MLGLTEAIKYIEHWSYNRNSYLHIHPAWRCLKRGKGWCKSSVARCCCSASLSIHSSYNSTYRRAPNSTTAALRLRCSAVSGVFVCFKWVYVTFYNQTRCQVKALNNNLLVFRTNPAARKRKAEHWRRLIVSIRPARLPYLLPIRLSPLSERKSERTIIYAIGNQIIYFNQKQTIQHSAYL